MRAILRTVLTPLAVVILLIAGASFAVATGTQHPPKPAEDVYPCRPDHIGEHGKDEKGGRGYKDRKAAAKARKATGKAARGRSSERMLTRYYKTGGSHGGNDNCQPECPKGSSYKTSSGGSHGGSNGNDCKPECPKSSSYKTSSGGSHGGSNGNDCKPECPKSSSYKTSSGGSHGNDNCEPDCKSSASKKSLKTSSSSGGSHGDDCKDEKPGCGPDKTNGVAGKSGQHTGQPPKADNRQDCPNPPGQQMRVIKK
jgi:hypothetical protein